MKIYLIRHGETEWNVKKVMQGSVDIPLNYNGKEQAEIMSEKLVDKKIDIIISSTLIRARETAEIIAEKLQLYVSFDDRIIERNYGEFEGKSKLLIDYESFWSFSKNLNYINAENINVAYNRVKSFFEDAIKKNKGKNILVVIHAGICKLAECYFNGYFNNGELASYVPNNCEIIEYDIKRED